MKKFLISAFQFLIVLLVLNLLLALVAKKVYFKDYGNYSNKFDSYLFADSHGLSLNNLGESSKVYNFSAGSESYHDIKRKITFLLQDQKISKIYLTVDDHTLSPYRQGMNNLDRSVVFSVADDYDNQYEYFTDRHLRYNLPFFQAKTRTVIKRFLTSWCLNFLGFETNMYNTNLPSWVELNEKQKIASSNRRKDLQFSADEPSKELNNSLLDIIKVCNENNIELVGIKFPLTSEYIQILGDHSFGADKIFKEQGLQILDFRTAMTDRPDLFSNQDHLNEEGGKHLAQLLFSID